MIHMRGLRLQYGRHGNDIDILFEQNIEKLVQILEMMVERERTLSWQGAPHIYPLASARPVAYRPKTWK